MNHDIKKHDATFGDENYYFGMEWPQLDAQSKLNICCAPPRLTYGFFIFLLTPTESNFVSRKSELQGMLDTANGIAVHSEDDLKDLFDLCRESYQKAITKDGLPPDLQANPQEEMQAPGEGDTEYLKAARGDGFDVNGPVWNYWTRKLTDPATGQMSQLAKDYALIQGRSNKKKWRDEWAAGEFKDLLVKKTFGETLVRQQGHEEEWHTFGGLVKLFGGWKWPAAIGGAKLHAAKTSRMGPRWCQVEELNGLMWFRRDKIRAIESLDKAWGKLTEWQTKAERKQDDAPQGDSKVPPSQVEVEAAALKGKTKAKAKPKGITTTPPPPPPLGDERGTPEEKRRSSSSRKSRLRSRRRPRSA